MIYKPFVKNTHKHAFVWRASRPLQTYLERAYKSQTKNPWLMQTITVKDAALFNSNLSASFQKKGCGGGKLQSSLEISVECLSAGGGRGWRQWGSEWHQCVCVCVCGLTTWSFVLHLYLFLKGTSHGLHLAWAAVSVPVTAANRVLVLQTGVWAFAHRLTVLNHAHSSKLAGLLQAGALQVKICPKKQRNKLSFYLDEDGKDKEEGNE